MIKINNDKKNAIIKEEAELLKNRKLNFISKFPLGIADPYLNYDSYTCLQCRDNEPTPFNMFGLDIFRDLYALRNNIQCTLCNSNKIIFNQLSTLSILNKFIEENPFNYIYLILGSTNNIGVVQMKENQINDIYLEEMDIPDDAIILDINLTPSGKLFPLELHGNNPRYKFKHDNNKLTYYPVELIPHPESIEESNLNLMIQWIKPINEISDNNLLNAIDSYIDSNQTELIMNCNRALELITGKICFKEFKKEKGKDSVENFLSTGATYSHQLNHLLNLICKANNIKEIENEILIKINSIRKNRNNIAHEGILKDNKILTKAERAEILSITILGTSLMKDIFSKI